MTEKLYYKDSFIKNFDATVLDCVKNGERFEILLDKTAFFPEGGGQGGDSGKIGDVTIFDTHEKEGKIWHYASSPISIGENVHCEIDFEKRFSRMQCHSGEHIVSGIIHSIFGYDNVGFHLGDSNVTIDINGVLTEDEIRKVEILANEAITKDFEINIFFPTPSEAKSISYRAKLEIEENLRIVEFPEYDICACCAPHVQRSGQIGIIKLLDYANYKGGLRIHMLCGMRALADYQERYGSVLKISNLLSAKQSEVYEAVEHLKAESEKQKHELASMRKMLAEEMAASSSDTDGNLIFFATALDAPSLRILVNSAIAKCGGICAAFCGADGAYTYCMASKTVNLRDKAKEISNALGGKGGGSAEMICGSVCASKEEITEYFK